MANKKDLDFTYTTIDKLFRLSVGETGDYSGAKYDGDFSLSLEQAQKAKHVFIADSLQITAGSKVLDMACGWGPFSRFIVEERKAESIGLTLSEGQAAACRLNGHNVIVKDCRFVSPADFGSFDAITCIGGLQGRKPPTGTLLRKRQLRGTFVSFELDESNGRNGRRPVLGQRRHFP